MKNFSLLLRVCAIFGILNSVLCETFYATPSTSTPCPEGVSSQCRTLSQYAADPNSFGSSTDIDLILLPGHHNLTSDLTIQDSSVTMFSMSALNPTSETVVTCSDLVRLELQNIAALSISGIQFNGCVENQITSIAQLFIQNCSFNGYGRSGSGMNLTEVDNGVITKSTFTTHIGGNRDRISSPDTSAGVMYIIDSTMQISNSTFDGNTALQGGAIYLVQSDLLINQSSFRNNAAIFVHNVTYNGASSGGSIFAAVATLQIYNTGFTNNSARGHTGYGGAILVGINSSTTISKCTFVRNAAKNSGGAINAFGNNGTRGIQISDTQFFQNEALIGSAIFIRYESMTGNSLTFMSNVATTSVVYIVTSTVVFEGDTTFANNTGSVFTFASNVTFFGITNFMFNSYSGISQEGGAVTSYQSTIFFVDSTSFLYNNAKIGGAIDAVESNIYMYDVINVSHNVAIQSGGGIYLYQSDLTFNGTVEVFNNTALKNGGGIHSVSSTASVRDGFVRITKNSAGKGGAMYFESNGKLFITKYRSECTGDARCTNRNSNDWIRLEITENTADYGGAFYVADETNSATCNSVPFRGLSTADECFFQSLAFHTIPIANLNIMNTYFINNTANIKGNMIYGGLLDRCKASQFSEIFVVESYMELTPAVVDAVSYLLNITNIQRADLQLEVKSDPVRICFCNDNRPNCSYRPPTFYTRRGERILIPLVAVDQVNSPVANSLISGYLTNQVGLRGGQSIQNTSESDTMCSKLPYNIFSLRESETLFLYAVGPCNDVGISITSVSITLVPCPPGFVTSGTACECDDILTPDFITNCSIDTGLVTRVREVWVSVVNATTENRDYVTYTNCPFDYCKPANQKVYIDLSVENGSDAQCAFNRTGKLCGACDRTKNLSHTFGGNRCLPCSNNWLALFIPFALAGVALVGFLLLCNLTVAVGSIDALIFYANIVGANRSTFLPFEKTNVLSIFIAWFNLDFGFETCFYDGLDEYAKIWLQLVFPAYIIFLVAMVITISKYSIFFARLLSKRNPIATLATLILLSFTKLVRTAIAALSFGRLNIYVNGTVETELVWLADGNVGYLQGKHIPLFITALIIFLACLVYTLLLFFWQWLLRCPNRSSVRWIQDSRLNAFMDAYNAPFTRRHRYWTGLLLCIRAILYLIFALDIFGDPKIPLCSILIAVGCLFLMKEVVRRRIYKDRPLNILDGIFLYNLLVFTAVSLYIRGTDRNQIALAYTSTSIAFAMFVLILIYHSYAYLLTNFAPFQKCTTYSKKRVYSKRNRHQTNTAVDNTKPLLPAQVDDQEPNYQDFSKYRGPLDLIDTQSFSDQSEEPQIQADHPVAVSRGNVTHTVVDVIPEEGTEEHSLHQD